MEAGLGALWGEDPHYFSRCGRLLQESNGSHVCRTFVARNRDGTLCRPTPASSRFLVAARLPAPGDPRVSALRVMWARASGWGCCEVWGVTRSPSSGRTSAISSFAESRLKAASQTCSRTKKTLQASDRPSPIDHNRSLFDDLSFPPATETISSESAQQNMSWSEACGRESGRSPKAEVLTNV